MTGLIVDGTNLVMRHACALLRDRARSGDYTQEEGARVLAQAEGMLRRAAEESGADATLVVFDSAGPTWRHEVLPSYKSNRQGSTDAWSAAFAWHVTLRGWRTLSTPGMEADDLAAAAVFAWSRRRLGDGDVRLVVLSGDSDLLQLLDAGAEVWQYEKPGERPFARRDRAYLEDRYGCATGEQLRTWKALVGEPGDGLPGVPGIGPVRAGRLIDAYRGHVTNIREAVGRYHPRRHDHGNVSAMFDLAYCLVGLDVSESPNVPAPGDCPARASDRVARTLADSPVEEGEGPAARVALNLAGRVALKYNLNNPNNRRDIGASRHEGGQTMGKEHGLMDRLANCAAKRRPAQLLAFEKDGFGGDTPNQKGLTVAVWLLEALFFGGNIAAAVARALQFMKAMPQHCSIGPEVNGEAGTEVLTPSHAQLWYAGMAGLLLGAMLARSQGVAGAAELVAAVVAWWRVETGAVRGCVYRDEKGAHVLTPGARAGTAAAPQVVNSARDKVVSGLLSDWKPAPRAGRDSYEVSVQLLSQAFREGIGPADILGEGPALDPVYDFHVVHGEGGDFYAWFGNLSNTLQPLHGAGRVGGQVVLEYDRSAAVARGEAMLGGAPTAEAGGVA